MRKQPFLSGTVVTLTATPDANTFTGWGGACAGTGACQVTLTADTLVVATFSPVATSETSFYHLDALGSVRVVTDDVGQVRARHDYFPFGEDAAPLTGDPRKFTGKERDSETALDYFGARYYRNVWGRFTSVDPAWAEQLALQDPQRWNRYSYVGNRPTRVVDPDGEGWLSATLKVAKAVVKGVDLAVAFKDVIDDAGKLVARDTAPGERAWAAVRLASEALPLSINDAKGIGSWIIKHGDNAGDAARDISRAVTPIGRGSTGRAVARDLFEQLAMEQAMANPLAGEILPVLMNDLTMEGKRRLGQDAAGDRFWKAKINGALSL